MRTYCQNCKKPIGWYENMKNHWTHNDDGGAWCSLRFAEKSMAVPVEDGVMVIFGERSAV